MKGFITVLIIAVIAVGVWGYSQSKAKKKAISELQNVSKSMDDAKAENKKLAQLSEKQNKEIAKLNDQVKKFENLKITLIKEVEQKKEEIENSKEQVANLQSKIKSMTVTRVAAPQVQPEKIQSTQHLASAKNEIEKTKIKRKIVILNNKIETYQAKARNAKYAIVEMENEDRIGWQWKKTDSRSRVRPIKELPKDWNRKTVRILYISKDEKREKMKQAYLKQVAEFERQKQELEKQLAQL